MASDFATRMVDADGVKLRVVDEGEGEAVLLLHGFPDSARLWRNQIPALVAAGFRVLAPDLRGFGGSDRPEGVEQYDIQRVLGDLAAVLEDARVERARVVGHDWGAFVAWCLASFAPARVS